MYFLNDTLKSIKLNRDFSFKKKTTTTAPVAAKKPVKSKFAEFKAQMLKKQQQPQDSQEPENDLVKADVIVEPENKPEVIAPKLTTPVKSPLKTKQLNMIMNEEIKKPRVSINLMSLETPDRNKPINVINEEDDFLNLDAFRPICFRNSILNPQIQNNDDAPQTPKTPRQFNSRRSLLSQQSSETVKSPLLKLAYISSHGKRLSRGGFN